MTANANTMTYDLPPEQWPSYMQGYPQLKQIRIGECKYPDRYQLKDEQYEQGAVAHSAHAHIYSGSICLATKDRLNNRNTMLHELAHIIGPEEYHEHGLLWAKTLLDLGGTLGHYQTAKNRCSTGYKLVYDANGQPSHYAVNRVSVCSNCDTLCAIMLWPRKLIAKL